MSNNPTTIHLLSQHLQTSTFALPALPAPHPLFLTSILASNSTATSSTNPSSLPTRQPPLPALAATARHRFLSTDITLPHILAPATASFPATISNAGIKELVLSEDIPVQVLSIVDIGQSKWTQIENLEAERKGEFTRGMEIIRVVPGDNNGEGGSQIPGANNTAVRTAAAGGGGGGGGWGPFKLVLQDGKGQKVEAFELRRVANIGLPPRMAIGCKMTLKAGTRVARGVVLLEPERCVVLGGRVERWESEWREGREERMREEVERDRAERAGINRVGS